jgi:acetylornithine deacetylase/succinyl-diaminopimelate desuccinylase-like protein
VKRPGAAAAVALALAAAAGSPAGRLESFEADWGRAQLALSRGDAATALPILGRLVEQAPEHPALLLALARSQALAGERDEALATLERCASLGGCPGAAQEPAFAPLSESPQFRAILRRLEETAKPVLSAAPAFSLDDPELVPEGIAYDSSADRFFVGSIRERKIVEVDRAGHARDFVGPGQDGLWSVLGMKADAATRALYAASEAEGPVMKGFQKDDGGRSGIFVFDLASGKLRRKYLLPEAAGKHLFNDLVVARNGDVLVTDSAEGSVYRAEAAAGTIRRFLGPDRFLYPNGIALSGDEQLLYVADAAGISCASLPDGRVFPLAHDPDVTLAEVDGLLFDRGRLLAVQNGFDPVRILCLKLSPGQDRVVSAQVLERHDPAVTSPTTGALAPDGFYFFANTLIDAFDEEGKLKPGRKLGAVNVLRIPAEKLGAENRNVAPRREESSVELRDRVRAWREAHEIEILSELRDFLSIPNVASDAANIGRNAEKILAMFRKRGLEARLLRVPNAPPAVFVELPAPGAARTITFYAHYDGQPVDAKQWKGSPWTPVLRGGRLEDGASEILWPPGKPLDGEWRLYARSASDDKAPIVGFLAALDALRSAGVAPRVNLKFLFEGEEEAGSPHLGEILKIHSDVLRTDAWVLCDGPVHQSWRPQVFFGARGTTDLEVTVYGPNHGLHSGHYGNWAVNPISRLAHLLDSMRDETGKIRIAGYEDDVRPLSSAEREALAAVPRVDEELRKEFGLGGVEGDGASLVELVQRPAVNFRGFFSGSVGAAASNTINPEASASIDFRLVPDQTLERVRDLVERHVRAQGYFIVHEAPDDAMRLAHPKVARLEWGGGYPAARTSIDLPVSREILRIADEQAGSPVVRMPMLGGSIPIYLFRGTSDPRGAGTPVVGVPIANHDNNQHAANENLRLRNLWDGIELYAALFARLGEPE